MLNPAALLEDSDNVPVTPLLGRQVKVLRTVFSKFGTSISNNKNVNNHNGESNGERNASSSEETSKYSPRYRSRESSDSIASAPSSPFLMKQENLKSLDDSASNKHPAKSTSGRFKEGGFMDLRVHTGHERKNLNAASSSEHINGKSAAAAEGDQASVISSASSNPGKSLLAMRRSLSRRLSRDNSSPAGESSVNTSSPRYHHLSLEITPRHYSLDSKDSSSAPSSPIIQPPSPGIISPRLEGVRKSVTRISGRLSVVAKELASLSHLHQHHHRSAENNNSSEENSPNKHPMEVILADDETQTKLKETLMAFGEQRYEDMLLRIHFCNAVVGYERILEDPNASPEFKSLKAARIVKTYLCEDSMFYLRGVPKSYKTHLVTFQDYEYLLCLKLFILEELLQSDIVTRMLFAHQQETVNRNDDRDMMRSEITEVPSTPIIVIGGRKGTEQRTRELSDDGVLEASV